ncbi:hypothetical protein BDK51DRAFT_26344 [Blyttiomyces helicus]|uniref:Uncharacterized protein n=1 Tax=Blyttiomyces helicus TaxID=388810 RepID=A0A4P9WQX7_9FUNG|nr:hypothetical protein BDK51DRAFT_26344 [Blyttiomyces helicus]|eukprot:RKO94238.1 hypothetical protein BDK51DRAFT_26344 [Blyttiomyces helicus]
MSSPTPRFHNQPDPHYTVDRLQPRYSLPAGHQDPHMRPTSNPHIPLGSVPILPGQPSRSLSTIPNRGLSCYVNFSHPIRAVSVFVNWDDLAADLLEREVPSQDPYADLASYRDAAMRLTTEDCERFRGAKAAYVARPPPSQLGLERWVREEEVQLRKAQRQILQWGRRTLRLPWDSPLLRHGDVPKPGGADTLSGCALKMFSDIHPPHPTPSGLPLERKPIWKKLKSSPSSRWAMQTLARKYRLIRTQGSPSFCGSAS